MLTDGGSIPRPLWVVRNYSPWGYAPAFIIHDWLFAVKHCEYPGFENLTLDGAALIMSEVMKTMMLDPKKGHVDKLTLYAMYEAVRSPFAQVVWDGGKCTPAPPPPPPGFFAESVPAIAKYTIEFP
jgi:hypothetical protein